MYFISNDLNEIEQIKKSCNKIKIRYCLESKKITVYYILENKFSMILKRIIYYFKVWKFHWRFFQTLKLYDPCEKRNNDRKKYWL